MTASPLSAHLKALIETDGPLTVARYMREALLHPEHGYYTTREPFGVAGDFITAPEISQTFGELIGLWCAAVWQQTGSPTKIALVECGPGRGTLMADALRAARIVPGFRDAIEVHLVEASPRLRALQRETLSGTDVTWHDTVETLPNAPSLILGNEFFDALPIRQLIHRDGMWRERCIVQDAGNDALGWSEMPAPADLVRLAPSALIPAEGDIFEICEDGRTVAEQIARHIAHCGGAGLFLDYGHGKSAFGDTFQALRGHQYVDVLEKPGTADLTAHVDFDALLESAASGGCTCFGTVTQGQFLTALGIEPRVQALVGKASPAQAATIRSGARRLIEPTEMGTLFKAVAIAAPGVDALPGFGPPRNRSMRETGAFSG
ncbi:SAM-dependent methyltransferase [uncultured Nisaea sp.]|uniref:class I SAM-dependent methyltransferase n=1 Tax=uncultured Nisaea sp. TaxID=538215 RepID=UPI0030EE4793|tara:strand:+ start:10106 stop:11236 length:1131 start_codon:yes stop_codon:yes gene_type:complete